MLEEIDIAEWHPERDGQGCSTRVHLMVRLKALPDATFVMRFQGPQTLAAVIQALTGHGLNVFGRDLADVPGDGRRRPGRAAVYCAVPDYIVH